MNLVFPENIKIDQGGAINIDFDDPFKNIINIDGIDYVIGYLDFETKKNRGGNSYILTLNNAQDFEEKGYSYPELVIKISRSSFKNWEPSKANRRFDNEIEALIECNRKNVLNVIQVFHSGICQIQKKVSGGRIIRPKFQFYTMEYANTDLKRYIENNNPSTYERIDFCIEIANGLKEVFDNGYYHRDLKPDNVFITEEGWKIGDLGLSIKRNEDNNLDDKNELIGPRGWLCPEAMNKFLTEDKNHMFAFDCTIDHQSDIFMLGKMFWYIMQGNAPIGCVKPVDFKIRNMQLYTIIRTMLNHSKKNRYFKIEDILKLLKPVHQKYYLEG